MPFVSPRFTLLSLAFAAITSAVVPDRRIVDAAQAGDPESEAAHGYVGDQAEAGVSDGKSFRKTSGYIYYSLKTFDDTEVTVACTFVGSNNVSQNYDVIVEDSVVATRSFSSPSTAVSTVEIPVPFGITKGKTHIAVIIRARGGSTPALREIRTVQYHNELGEQK